MHARRVLRLKLIACAGMLAWLGHGADAAAGDKKSKPSPVNIDDLFGAPPAKPSGLDAMRKATEEVEAKGHTDDLAPRSADIDKEPEVAFTGVFAATKIEHDRRLGCRPTGRDRIKISHWTFNELPARGPQNFEVCLHLTSSVGREVKLSMAIVDMRNQRVARGEDVVNFNGRAKVDHVLEYPAPLFKLPGQYFYVVDVEGKEVARLPLFTVKLAGEPAEPADSESPVGVDTVRSGR